MIYSVKKLLFNNNLIYLILISFLLALIFSVNLIPSEDAIILFRYSENFADTGVISYNNNSEKVEGATDFLWMIILSFINFFGIDIYFSAIFLNLICLSILSIILTRELNLSNYYIYFIFLFHFFLGFTWSSIFGFSVLTTELILFLFLFFYKKNRTSLMLFTALIGALLRPDFIIFIFLICFMSFFEKTNLKKIINYSICFLVGLIYFFWRYKYFGYIFPNSYYVKSQWLFLNNLSWLKEILILLPFLIYIIKLKNFKIFFNKKNYIIFFTIIIATAYYSSQTLYQNIGNRFYFYFFPFLFIYLIDLSKLIKNFNKFFTACLIFSLSVSLALNISLKSVYPFYLIKNKNINLKENTKNSTRYLLPMMLKENFKSLNIATTEAGSVPYYSKFFSVDLFGLNTKEFAKMPAGGKYLIENKFDIVVISSSQKGTNCFGLSSLSDASKSFKPKYNSERNANWDQFTLQLMTGIDQINYDAYLVPLYDKNHSNTFFFVNKKSKNFTKLNEILLKFGKICKF